MGASASVQGHGRPWWGGAREVKEALEGGKWQQLVHHHVNTTDPRTGRMLLHEVLQPGCRGVADAASSVKMLVGCGAASVADGEGRTPVWYALQHRDEGTRSVLLAALGDHVKEIQTEVASRLRNFLTDEWPYLRTRVAAAADAARTASAALDHQQPQSLQEFLTDELPALRARVAAAAVRTTSNALGQSQSQSLRNFLTGEWPALRVRVAAVAAADAARTASQSSQEGQTQGNRTHKPGDKDKTSERLENHVDGRKICFTRNNKACEAPLLEWLEELLTVHPDLGYRAEHVNSMLLGLRFVVQRVLRRVEATPHAIEDWMAVDDWFEHLCAGYLFTCDCVEYQIDTATGDLVCKADGVPIVEKYHEDITDEDVLRNHGAKYMRPALYFGMNHAMRTIGLSKEARDSAAGSVFKLEPAPAQLHVVETFQPLMTKLTRLIRSRRPSLTTVFRGINVNVSAQYKVGTSVVWNAFTSTTKKQDVAKTFMYGKAGTFFVIVAKQGAAEVGFASVFPQEAELLYDSNIEFRVQWKLSPTLLRMVGQPFDVIVMQEVAGHNNNNNGNSDASTAVPTQGHTHPDDVADQVEAVRQVLQHTASLFAEFLDGYVEGRVGDDTHVPEAETRMLLHEVDVWLAADGDAEEGAGAGTRETPRDPLCLVGDGGTGKTSAAVAVLCHLLQEKKAGGVVPQRKKPVFPVFVALPAIGVGAVTTRGGIDDFIRNSFGLEEAALEHLSSVYDVVVILDSLDEVGLTQEHLSGAYKESRGQGVLRLHPWCAKQCSVILTTRGEYLKSVGHTASQVCGEKTRALYMQPFTQADAVTYISKVRAAQVAKAEQQRVDACFNANHQRQLAAIVRDTCGAADATVPLSHRALVVSIVERAWVLAGGDDDSTGGTASTAAPTHTTTAAGQQVENKHSAAVEGASAGNLQERVPGTGQWCVQAAAEAVMSALEGRGGSTPLAAAPSVPLRVVLVALSQQAGFLEWREAALLRAAKGTSPPEDVAAEPIPPHTVGDVEMAVLSQLRNPFLLHMAFYAQRDLSTTTQAHQCLSDVAVYEAYLQKYVEVELRQLCQGAAGAARVEEVLQVGELIACAMLEAQTWQGVLGTERAHLSKEDNVGPSEADEAFRVLPFRVESFEDDSSAFTFRHKTLGEFLVARRLSRKGGAETLGSKVRRAFSQDAPNVLQYFADTVLSRGGDALDAKVSDELIPLVLGSRHAWGGDTASLMAASNAMALAARTRYVFGCDLTGVLLRDSDVRHARLCGTVLTETRFHNCWLDHAMFSKSDLTRSDWTGCSFGAPLPPLLGHTSSVSAVAVTPDGSKIISGSYDKSVRVWDASTGKELQKLEGHTESVYAVAVTPDGSKIISGSRDNSVRVWDASTGKELQKLEGHTESVSAVAVTPDGSKIILGSYDDSVRVWDASTGKELQKLEGHTDSVFAVAVTPDGSKIISGSYDESVRVWDASTGKELQKLEGHTESVNAVAVTPDGSKIISGSYDESVRVWDASTGKELQKLEGHTDSVLAVAVTPDGSKIISGSSDNSVRVWDASTGKELQKPEGHTDSVFAVAVTPDGSKIISGSWDKSVRVWDASTGKELQKLEGHTGSVNAVAVTPDGSKIISGFSDESVRVWDASTGKELQKLEGHTESVLAVAVTPDGSKIISGSLDNSVRVWDASTGKELQKLEGHTESVNAVAVTPDGSKIISGSLDNSVRVWDASTGKELQKLEGHTSSVSAVAVTPDGSKIISGSSDNSVRVWDASTGKELQKLEGHTESVDAVAVTPDGSKIISGSSDNSVRVWDASTGKELPKPEGHTSSTPGMAVTSCGPQLIGVSDNGGRICAGTWRLSAVLGATPIVPVPFECRGLDTVMPPAVRALLGGASTDL